jgi:AraC-like DNA-binding protein
MESEEIMRQANQLESLHKKADNYLHKLDTQRIINWLAVSIIILLLVVFILFYLYYLKKVNMQRERVVNTLWNLKPEDIPVSSKQTEDMESAVISDETEEKEPVAVSQFIIRFKEVIETRLEESEVSVEDLAADMNLSRVQLYRKVKSVTGSSPVELLRTARLNRAYQILLTTDKSVSEVAYAAGFTAPSYFTKCFKEEYGMVPGDIRK